MKKPGAIALAIMKSKKDPVPEEDPMEGESEETGSDQVAFDEYADAMEAGDREAAKTALEAFVNSCKY